MHASPTTAQASTYMHACVSTGPLAFENSYNVCTHTQTRAHARVTNHCSDKHVHERTCVRQRVPQHKLTPRGKGLDTHAATRAYARHQPLLRKACTCTRVRPLVHQHAKKRSSKVCTHKQTRTHARHQLLLRQARTCTRVRQSVSQHEKKP
jgi:hypothetical protein